MTTISKKIYDDIIEDSNAFSKDLSEKVNSKEETIDLLKLSEAQSLCYAKDLAKAIKHEKSQNQALKIANFQVQHFVKELELRNDSINKAYLGTLRCLALAADFKDRHTGEHIVRMSRYMAYLALLSGFSTDDIKSILFVAPMHDIGKIGIPDAILNKPALLTDSERQIMQNHTIYAVEILSGSDSDLMRLAIEVALTHHERWDGKGYPNGVSKQEIPKVGRVAAIADVFDALTMARPYKGAMSFEAAFDVVVRDRGKAFDPDLVDLFKNNIDGFIKIKADVDKLEGVASKAKLLMGNESEFFGWLEKQS
jgi:HD-GYP domain-containing protein (c-di-GMP phosphodiesterase class II)